MDPNADTVFATQKALWDSWMALARQLAPVPPFDERWAITLLDWHLTMIEYQAGMNQSIASAWCQITYSLNPFLTMASGTQPTPFMTLQDIVSRAWGCPFDLSQPYEPASGSHRRSSQAAAAGHASDSSVRDG